MNIYDRDIDTETEPIGDLLKDLRDEVMIMIRQQIELAKSETNEKVSSLFRNTGVLFAGGLVLFTGFLALIAGLTFFRISGTACRRCHSRNCHVVDAAYHGGDRWRYWCYTCNEVY